MRTHAHCEAAFNYLLQYEGSSFLPFPVVTSVLRQFDPQKLECAARQLMMLSLALDEQTAECDRHSAVLASTLLSPRSRARGLI